MSWIKEGIDRLLSLAQPDSIEVDGRSFVTENVNEVKPKVITPLVIHSLQGLVDYLTDCKDDGNKMIQVVDPTRVIVMDTTADPVHRHREYFAEAKLIQSGFPFGQYIPQEDMIVALHTQFRQSANRDKLLRICAGLIVKAEVQTTDDGLSQRVQAQVGVTRVQEVDIENPVMLQPIRTFTEVEQPEAPYVVRIKGGEKIAPTVAIYEADGGQWKNAAIANIRTWLSAKLPGMKIIG